MDEATSEKFRKKLKKLASFIIDNGITKADMLEECLNDTNVQVYRDIIGKTCDYFEWRIHPNHPEIECSTSGQIRVSGKIIKPIEWDGKLMISMSRKRKLDAANVVLTTFRQRPADGSYIVRFRNEDYRDLRIDNLYWYKLMTSPIR